MIWASPRPRARKRRAPAMKSSKKSAEDARMEALYREHILKEPKPEPQGGFIPLGAIAPAAPKAEVQQEKKEEVFGD